MSTGIGRRRLMEAGAASQAVGQPEQADRSQVPDPTALKVQCTKAQRSKVKPKKR